MSRQTVLGWLDAKQEASPQIAGPETKKRADDDITALAEGPETRSRGDDGETFVRGEGPETAIRGDE